MAMVEPWSMAEKKAGDAKAEDIPMVESIENLSSQGQASMGERRKAIRIWKRIDSFEPGKKN